MDDLGFIVAGYTITLGALAGYVGILFARARRARARAVAVAAARAGDGRARGARPSPP